MNNNDIVLIMLFSTLIIALIVSTTLVIMGLYRKNKQEAFDKLHGYILANELKAKGLIFYTTGHPYTWSEITYQEVLKRIKNDCWAQFTTAMIPKPSSFLLRANKERNALHIVFNEKEEFDWSSLKYYDEYIKNYETSD